MSRSGFLLLSLLTLVAACALAYILLPGRVGPPHYKPVRLKDQPGWDRADPMASLKLFLAACGKRPWTRAGHADPALGVDSAAWEAACLRARRISPAEARLFFETSFRAVEIRQGRSEAGFFTGYFEPLLEGARAPGPGYPAPLYRRPPELVMVNLGQFRDDMKGVRIAGEVEGAYLRPYAPRAAIEAGALQGRGLELVWVKDPVEAFMLQVQGSGRVKFEDGGVMRVGYDGQNGHPYRSIGKLLVEMGEMKAEDVTLETLIAWLRAHPERGLALMAENPSFVFFREIKGDGPTGALGLPVAAEKSLAVDPEYSPLGLPVWIDSKIVKDNALTADEDPARTYRRLMLGIDTGGAIRGPGRADIFFGYGPRARHLASGQKFSGRYVLLVPMAAPG